MHISNTNQVNQIYQIQRQTSTISNNLATSPKNGTITDTVSISNEGLNAEDNWQKIADKYNVTNISQNEIASMVSSLNDNKLISSTEGLYLMAPRSMDLNPDAKFDLLATTRKALDFAKIQGDSGEGIKNRERQIDILETLQELSRKT